MVGIGALPLPEVFLLSPLLKAKRPQAFNNDYQTGDRSVLMQEVLPRGPETASQLPIEENN